MESLAKIRNTLARCESELQRIAAEAMSSGDYETARYGLGLAESIAAQRQRAEVDAAPANKNEGTTASNQKKTQVKTAVKQQNTRAKPAKKTGAYPRFIRSGDLLIKVGWSKKTRKEYQHKAPYTAVEAFAGHLLKHTRDGKPFTMEDLMPIPDEANGGELPGYQAYLVLAWLRSNEAVAKQGREGYVANHAMLGEKALSQSWQALSSNGS